MKSEQEISNHSLINKDELINFIAKDKFAYLIGILSQFFWACNVVQMKTFINYFPDCYSDNSVLLWRMSTVALIGYSICKYKKIYIQKFPEINNKKWFLLRNATAYIYITCWVKMYSYFRVSTISVIGSTAPLLIIILSVILIGEKFYLRYLYGIFLCILGATIIILNDKKPESKPQILNDNILVGILFSLTNDSLYSLSAIGQKVLTKEGMDIDLQNYYFGLYNAVPAFIVFILNGEFKKMNIKYILYLGINGILLYLSIYLTIITLKYMAVSKFQLITYSNVVFIFLLSYIILGEHIFFTDILGALIIIGFQYYNLMYPPEGNINLNIEKEGNIKRQNL